MVDRLARIHPKVAFSFICLGVWGGGGGGVDALGEALQEKAFFLVFSSAKAVKM